MIVSACIVAIHDVLLPVPTLKGVLQVPSPIALVAIHLERETINKYTVNE